jgi:hypothetical protein
MIIEAILSRILSTRPCSRREVEPFNPWICKPSVILRCKDGLSTCADTFTKKEFKIDAPEIGYVNIKLAGELKDLQD